VKNPGELKLLKVNGPQHGLVMGPDMFSYPMYRDLRDRNRVFGGVAAYFDFSASLAYRGQTGRARMELVSGNFFDVLGVSAPLGRTLTEDDDRNAGAHPLLVMTNDYWRRRFGADTSILNKTVEVNGQPMTVVGVTRAGFNGMSVGTPADFFVPVTMKARMTPGWDDLENRRSLWLTVMGRLKPGVSAQQAEADLNTLLHPVLEMELKDLPGQSDNFRKRFLARHISLEAGDRGRSQFRETFSAPLLVLMAMVGLVLLIACANVANLLVARAASRQKEMAIRLALGAGRWRIVRQLLVESVTLAVLGGALGMLVAAWTGSFLIGFLPYEGALRTFSSDPDARVMAFSLALSLATGLLFGLVPALQATRSTVAGTLKDQASNVSAGSAHVRFRKALVVAQVTFSLLLLIGAGLFARSLYNLKSLYPGFDSANLMTFSVDPSLNGYSDQRSREFFERLAGALASAPGIQSVTMSELGLLKGNDTISTTSAEGYNAKENENTNLNYNWIGPAYFSTLHVPLLAGREFTERDRAGAPKTAIINEQTARYFFGHANPLGRHLGRGRGPKTKFDMEIVGVVKNSRDTELRGEIPRFVFLPYPQDEHLTQMTVFIRTPRDPAAVTALLRNKTQMLDPNMPLFEVKSMKQQVDESLFTDRIIAILSTFFGLLATLLAAVGLYGVMAYTVARRTREIGVRMALGAGRAEVLWMVLREVVILAAAGIAIALPAAYGLSRLVRSQLFGIGAADPAVMAVAVVLLGGVALLAGYLPALRATRIDPMVALRYE